MRRWKRYTRDKTGSAHGNLFGIALGLGAATTIAAVNSSLRVELGWKFVRVYVVVAPLSYDLGLIAWVYYLLAANPKFVSITYRRPSIFRAGMLRWSSW